MDSVISSQGHYPEHIRTKGLALLLAEKQNHEDLLRGQVSFIMNFH
jgi:hypothetical protein